MKSYGRFAWIYDLDGNKIELWQPLGRKSPKEPSTALTQSVFPVATVPYLRGRPLSSCLPRPLTPFLASLLTFLLTGAVRPW